MKNIKTTLLVIICISTATLLKAQQAKEPQTQVAKEVEVKLPTAADVNKNPSPAPEFKPQAAGTSAQKNSSEIPADMKVEKVQPLPLPAKNPNSNLTAEQIKTANGTSERPVMVVTPGTEAKPAKSKPIVAVAPAGQ